MSTMSVLTDLVIIDEQTHALVPGSVRDAAMELGSCVNAIEHARGKMRPSGLVALDFPVQETAGGEPVRASFEDQEQIG